MPDVNFIVALAGLIFAAIAALASLVATVVASRSNADANRARASADAAQSRAIESAERTALALEDANSVPVLIELFREHRSDYLAQIRSMLHKEGLPEDVEGGLVSLPAEKGKQIRDLMWFYDNLGVLVMHGLVDVRPISGYLGGSVLEVWQIVTPLVLAEREVRRRSGQPDPDRWQQYFELLYNAVKVDSPTAARDVWSTYLANRVATR